LTSVMKEMTTAVEDVIGGAVDGEFDSTPYVGTLENGGVGLAPYHDFEDEVPAELTEEIESLTQEIIDGTVEIETDAAPEQSCSGDVTGSRPRHRTRPRPGDRPAPRKPP